MAFLHNNTFNFDESVQICEAFLASRELAASRIDAEVMQWVAQDTEVACYVALARVASNSDQAIFEARRRLNARIQIEDMQSRARKLRHSESDLQGPTRALERAEEVLQHCHDEINELAKQGNEARTSMHAAEDALLEAERQSNRKKRKRQDADEAEDSDEVVKEDNDQNEVRPDPRGGQELVTVESSNDVPLTRDSRIVSADVRRWFDIPDRTVSRGPSKGIRVKRFKAND